VPVLAADHQGAGAFGLIHQGCDPGGDAISTWDEEGPRRVGEVVLNIHHDQGGTGSQKISLLHPIILRRALPDGAPSERRKLSSFA
jgi:hypothetical protein